MESFLIATLQSHHPAENVNIHSCVMQQGSLGLNGRLSRYRALRQLARWKRAGQGLLHPLRCRSFRTQRAAARSPFGRSMKGGEVSVVATSAGSFVPHSRLCLLDLAAPSMNVRSRGAARQRPTGAVWPQRAGKRRRSP